jgi:hypothetical protein
MRFDQSQVILPGFILPPATYNADSTPVTYDLGKCDAATLLIGVGVGGITFSGTNKIEFVWTHSDAAAEGFANVTAADVEGLSTVTTGIVRALIAAHATPSVTKLGYKGGKRYHRLLADFSGTHGTGTPLFGMFVAGILDRAPV